MNLVITFLSIVVFGEMLASKQYGHALLAGLCMIFMLMVMFGKLK